MKCALCDRNNLTAKELAVHNRFFHNHARNVPAPVVASMQNNPSRGACPDCGGTLFYQEGCAKCTTCGYSKCE